MLKYERRVNSVFTFFESEDQAKSHEVLIGIVIIQNSIRFNLNAGIGSMEQNTHGQIVPSSSFSTQYEMVSKSGICIPLEVETSVRSLRYIGVLLTGFIVLSQFKPIGGLHLSILLGYL